MVPVHTPTWWASATGSSFTNDVCGRPCVPSYIGKMHISWSIDCYLSKGRLLATKHPAEPTKEARSRYKRRPDTLGTRILVEVGEKGDRRCSGRPAVPGLGANICHVRKREGGRQDWVNALLRMCIFPERLPHWVERRCGSECLDMDLKQWPHDIG